MSTPLLGIVERDQLGTKSQMQLFCVSSRDACEHAYWVVYSLRREISALEGKTYNTNPGGQV
jgi:hypothetical protein